MEAASKKTPPGRPRDEQSRKAILKATFTRLLHHGYGALALEQIAKEAGVGKTTIYRWWGSRAALAVESFFDETVNELAFPDTGSAAEDFRLQLQQLAALLRSQRGGVLAALIIGSRNDPDLVLAIREQWVKPRQVWGVARLKRAVAEGECSADLDIRQALDIFYSSLYAHLFLGIPVHSSEEIDQHCRFVFPTVFIVRQSYVSAP